MYDRPLFSSRLVQVGVFRCPVGHPRFTDSGPTETYCLVFPRNAVWIAHEGRPPFVADATVVPVYNPGRPYRRGPISAAGDRSDWFAVAPDVLREIVARYDACAADSDALFRFGWTPSDAATYLAQRQIYRHVRGERPVDRLWVEESVISLAAAVLARACRRRTMSAAACATRDGRLAARVRESLAASFCGSGGLEALANDVGASVFHLCRVFRRESGGTIHQYRTQLRLRRSLELLDQGETDILDVALRVGFCSHSHFTRVFHAAFGVTPSAFATGERSLREPSVARVIQLRSRRACSDGSATDAPERQRVATEALYAMPRT